MRLSGVVYFCAFKESEIRIITQSMKYTVKRYDTYLSLKSELTCKLHREGFPEGEDMTKSAELSSLLEWGRE